MCTKCKTKYQNIIEGYFRLLIKNEKSEKLAISRAMICGDCDKASKTNFCEECKCYIPAKIRAKDETCILNKW